MVQGGLHHAGIGGGILQDHARRHGPPRLLGAQLQVYSTVCMPYCTGTSIGACNSTVKIGQLLYDLPLIGKVLAYAAAAAGQVKV